MDIKEFIAAPQAAMASLGLSAEDDKGRRLLELADQSTTLKCRLKEIKKDKADIARQFKTVLAQERDQLIARMQVVSAEVKHLEEQLKQIEKSLAELIAQPAAPVEAVPPFVKVPEKNHYAGDYTIHELQPEDIPRWNTFVAARTASAYHQVVWPEIIKNSFGHPTRIWVAEDTDGNILAGVPLTFFSSRLFGRFAVSIPYFNYGGVISDWVNVARDLITSLHHVCVNEGLSHIEVRTMQAELGDHASDKKVSMVLTLPPTEAELDEQLGAKVRAQYKKAQEYNPQVSFGKLELLDDFYQVFAQNMRDLGTPVYSREWFANILSATDVNSQLIVVYVSGRPVSTGFVIGHGEMLEIPWASTIRQANAMNTNMWMYRQILGYAIREGYRFFDFGRSTRGAGTYHFKKQWGAKPYPHYWYYVFPAGGSVPELNPDNPKYKLMISIWKRIPVWITKLIGPPIVANLP